MTRSTSGVLICDDAPFMRRMIADILRGAGYPIVGEARDGVEAVEQYQALRPEIVTMDIVMPRLGGIDAVREIVRVDPDARIVMCSAMGHQEVIDAALEAGARDFVVKPFQASSVLEAVHRVLH
ncbi:MAG: response regulator [Gemmatimonadota bacterium]